MREYVAFVHEIVEELAAAGRLRAIDPTVATYMVMGSILWVPRWFREGGRLTSAQVAYEVAWSTVDALLAARSVLAARDVTVAPVPYAFEPRSHLARTARPSSSRYPVSSK